MFFVAGKSYAIKNSNAASAKSYLDKVCAGTKAYYKIEKTDPRFKVHWKIDELNFKKTTDTLEVNWNTVGEYTLTVQELSDVCAGQERTYTVLVSAPEVNLEDKDLCDGDSLQLSFPEHLSATLYENNSVYNNYTIKESVTLQVKITDSLSCIDSVMVSYRFLPSPEFDVKDTTVCPNEVIEYELPYDDVIWTYGRDAHIESSFLLEPVLQPQTINVKATNQYNCTSSSSFTIRPCDMQTLVEKTLGAITNTFTPNGDGQHDNWEIHNIELYPNARIEVFDRWGRRVYFKENGYQNDWDGTFDGKDLPMDNYFYVINLNVEGAGILKGSLTIIR